MKKMDRRVRRTRRQLNVAMLELVVEKNYEAITIHDITERADLNRATFYLHYGSKDELMVESLTAHFDELVSRMSTQTADIKVWEDPLPIQHVFEYVAQHHQLFKTLFSENGLGYVSHSIIRYIAAYNMSKTTMLDLSEQEIPAPVVAWHVAGSLYALIIWWLDNDLPFPPAKMAQITFQLCTRGTYSVLQHILDDLPMKA